MTPVRCVNLKICLVTLSFAVWLDLGYSEPKVADDVKT